MKFFVLYGVIIASMGITVVLALSVVHQADQPREDEVREALRTGHALPRFVSVKANRANVRTGPDRPGPDQRYYPIKWRYTQRGVPVMIIDEFGEWRRIRDWQDSEGWMHFSLLSARRTVMVVETQQTLYDSPRLEAQAIAHVERGVIGNVRSCTQDWCRISVDSYEAWIRREALWGVLDGELIE